ncbi:hypothetical protein Bca52824_050336 [Brassica carinata]|uniref:Uncharacterized protein n=1 Tax=Brassica carinata TaxID=52824 RepID=A0A8X7UTY1_BRACI|nr:hypothetical protein Bca52824_050336 [Brassica carinata]
MINFRDWAQEEPDVEVGSIASELDRAFGPRGDRYDDMEMEIGKRQELGEEEEEERSQATGGSDLKSPVSFAGRENDDTRKEKMVTMLWPLRSEA